MIAQLAAIVGAAVGLCVLGVLVIGWIFAAEYAE